MFGNLRKAIAFVVAAHVPIVGLTVLPVLLGWPVLLMPVHILFLQLIIDPACSVVFEAEPLEADAMQAPPRASHQRLFDRALLVRGLFQGAGLLVLVLAFHAAARTLLPADAQRDDAARALTFVVLVLANLALIQGNRRWGRGEARRPNAGSACFGWIAAASVAVLAGVLATPTIRRLFAFAAPPPLWLLWAVAVAALSAAWFDFTKRVLRARHPFGKAALG